MSATSQVSSGDWKSSGRRGSRKPPHDPTSKGESQQVPVKIMQRRREESSQEATKSSAAASAERETGSRNSGKPKGGGPGAPNTTSGRSKWADAKKAVPAVRGDAPRKQGERPPGAARKEPAGDYKNSEGLKSQKGEEKKPVQGQGSAGSQAVQPPKQKAWKVPVKMEFGDLLIVTSTGKIRLKEPGRKELAPKIHRPTNKERRIAQKLPDAFPKIKLPKRLAANSASLKTAVKPRGVVKKRKLPKPTKLRRILEAERKEKQRAAAEKGAPLEIPGDAASAVPVPEGELATVSSSDTHAEERPGVPQADATTTASFADPRWEQVVHDVPSNYPRPREYVNHVVSLELNHKIAELLKKLKFFQERAVARDSVKGRGRKRLVAGLREVYRAAERGKLRCCIVATNIDKSEAAGSLDEQVSKILAACKQNEIPDVYAMTRNRLGDALGKKLPVAVVGILSADGAHEELAAAFALVKDLRSRFQDQLSKTA